MTKSTPNTSISKEIQLAQQCCQLFFGTIQNDDLVALLQSNKSEWNWSEFFNLIRTHKLDAIVFYAFRQIQMGQRRPKVMEQLVKLRKIRSRRKLNLFGEHVRVIQAFAEAKIKIVSYKGQAFTSQFYPHQRLRDSVDIDLAIHEKDIIASSKLMRSMGYVLHKDQSADEENILKSRSYYIDFSWVKHDDNGNILYNTEIHWQPSHSVLWVPLKFEDIIDQTVTVPVFNKEITTFPTDIQIVIVITHHGLVDGWGKLRHLVDLAQLLRRLTPQEIIDIQPILKRYKVYHTFLLGHELIQRIFNIPAYPDIPAYRSKIVDQMAQAIMVNELVGKWSDHKIKLYYYLKMRDNWRDRLVSLAKFGQFLLRNK